MTPQEKDKMELGMIKAMIAGFVSGFILAMCLYKN